MVVKEGLGASLLEGSETAEPGRKEASKRGAESQLFLGLEEGPRGLLSGTNSRPPSQAQEGRRGEARNPSNFLSVEEGPRGLLSGRNLRRPSQSQEAASKRSAGSQHFLSVGKEPRGLLFGRNLRRPSQA